MSKHLPTARTVPGKPIQICAALLVAAFLVPAPAPAQTTELRDAVRGVTYYSTQISSDPKTALQIDGSLFSGSDVMTLGLSAFFFDESGSVDEYVIWMRHDGPRRWFIGDIDRPVEIFAGDSVLRPAPSHRSRLPEPTRSEPLIEKLEFAISPAELDAMVNSDEVVIEVTTLLGTVVKRLTAAEIAAIAEFADEARARHLGNQTALPRQHRRPAGSRS